MVDCFDFVVNIFVLFLCCCFEFIYIINYCNIGMALVEDVYIEVELDFELDYIFLIFVLSMV